MFKTSAIEVEPVEPILNRSTPPLRKLTKLPVNTPGFEGLYVEVAKSRRIPVPINVEVE